MDLAPWNLFRPLLVGVAIVTNGTLPVAILNGWSINRMLGEQFAGSGVTGATSGLFESDFLANNLFSDSPGGIILFSVARLFATIVGFVEARRMVMVEGNEAITEAVSSPTVELVSGH